MTELEKKTEDLCKEIVSSPLVQHYLLAKEAFTSSLKVKELTTKINQGKKSLASIDQNQIVAKIKELKQLEDEYDNLEEVINYLNLKKEVEELLLPLEQMFTLSN